MSAQILSALLLWVAASESVAQAPDFATRLSDAAIERTRHHVVYDASYVRLDYPMGDVSPDRGVCADVVVRAFRAVGVDLQQALHEDMSAAFSEYPNHWGLARADANIDHRRVPNLETFFMRQGASIPVSSDLSGYAAGDVVTWNLRGASGGWLPHIGVVTNRVAPSGRPLVVHNIGAGPKLEDVLFAWEVTGHYRYPGPSG